MTIAAPDATATRPTERLPWADVAKGACIVLVVLWHVTRKDLLQLPWDTGVPVTGAWGQVSELLLPVRMPLFFLISGLVAVRVLSKPWGEVVARRVAPLLYLYVLWTVVQTVVLQLTPGFDTAVADSVPGVLRQLGYDPGNLWYLVALAVYVAVARVTRSRPGPALAAALALSVVASAGVLPLHGNQPSVLANLVWFLLGTQLHVLPWATRWLARPRRLTVLAVVLFAVGATIWQVGGADHVPGVRPLLGLLGVVAGAGLAALVAGVQGVGPGLQTLGRQTLPVYVLHLPLVALVHLGSSHVVTAGSGLAGSTTLALVYPVVVTALVVAASLALHRLLQRTGAQWLLDAPWRPAALAERVAPCGPASPSPSS